METTIKIDDNIRIIITIDEEMSALEFLGLTQKAKQLFNVASDILPTLKYGASSGKELRS